MGHARSTVNSQPSNGDNTCAGFFFIFFFFFAWFFFFFFWGGAKDAIPVSKHPMEIAGSSPAMTGLAARAVRQQQGRLV